MTKQNHTPNVYEVLRNTSRGRIQTRTRCIFTLEIMGSFILGLPMCTCTRVSSPPIKRLKVSPHSDSTGARYYDNMIWERRSQQQPVPLIHQTAPSNSGTLLCSKRTCDFQPILSLGIGGSHHVGRKLRRINLVIESKASNSSFHR